MAGWLDEVMKIATGSTPDELHVEGGKVYPQENNAENQGGHRLASKRMTDRFGPLLSQPAGVANELFEAASRKAAGAPAFPGGIDESLRDLGANWRGMEDSLGESAAIIKAFVKRKK